MRHKWHKPGAVKKRCLFKSMSLTLDQTSQNIKQVPTGFPFFKICCSDSEFKELLLTNNWQKRPKWKGASFAKSGTFTGACSHLTNALHLIVGKIHGFWTVVVLPWFQFVLQALIVDFGESGKTFGSEPVQWQTRHPQQYQLGKWC